MGMVQARGGRVRHGVLLVVSGAVFPERGRFPHHPARAHLPLLLALRAAGYVAMNFAAHAASCRRLGGGDWSRGPEQGGFLTRRFYSRRRPQAMQLAATDAATDAASCTALGELPLLDNTIQICSI